MKKVLILGIGCNLDTWSMMFDTSRTTWDSVEVPNVETVFYFGRPVKENTDKAIYFDIVEDYYTMSEKMLRAFEWALANKEFDYVARVNSSCYVDKKRLIEYVQTLPYNNVFAGGIVKGDPYWCWGGLQFILSKDVVQKLVDNREMWNHQVMEDVGISELATKLNIPFMDGKGCSINKKGEQWSLVGYGGESFEFIDFADCNKSGQHFYRVKNDLDRSVDAVIMRELFLNLNK